MGYLSNGHQSQTTSSKMRTYFQRHSKFIFVVNFLLVVINLFTFVMQGSKRPVDLWMFESVMDKSAERRFDSLLRTFTNIMDIHNITYFMYQGTLLGSYRHHGHLLWDDDVDFMVNIKEKQKIRDIIVDMGTKYAYFSRGPNELIKFFYRISPEHPTFAPEADVTWPHVDVSFYLENDTHIWDPTWGWQGFVFPKSEVFPLITRPFDGLILPSPNSPEKILKRSYDITRCRTHMFSHRLLVVIPYFMTAEKKCDALRNRIPFVNRFRTGCTITERQQLYGWTMNEFNTSVPPGEPCS